MNAVTMTPVFSDSPMAVAMTRYASAVRAAERVRWDIDLDVLRNRDFDMTESFLPPGPSLVDVPARMSADARVNRTNGAPRSLSSRVAPLAIPNTRCV
jgi:hypothetical protein